MTTGSASKQRRTAKSRAGYFKLSKEEAVLWKRYIAKRTDANRNAIAEFYLPLLDSKILQKLKQKYPFMDGDLRQDAAIGLLEAIQGFEPSRNVQFLSYASRRIVGSVADGLRKLDGVPRLIRKRMNRLQNAEIAWDKKHHGIPTEKQLAREAGIKLQTLREWRSEIQLTNISVLSDSALSKSDNQYSEQDFNRSVPSMMTLADKLQSSPAAHSYMTEWWESLLRGGIELERVVIVLHYYYQWTMRVIGIHTGLSESRISQVESDFFGRLKSFRNFNDFSDIPDNKQIMKCLRHILPICHKLRRHKNKRWEKHAK